MAGSRQRRRAACRLDRAALVSAAAASALAAAASPAFAAARTPSVRSCQSAVALGAASRPPACAAGAPAKGQLAWTFGVSGAAAAVAVAAATQRSGARVRSGRRAEGEEETPAAASTLVKEKEEKKDEKKEGLLGIDWGPRTGFAKERPLPSNAEFFGNTIWFDVELKKPIGITLEDGPEGPGSGTGVGSVGETGSARELMEEAIAGRAIMWVQEGDALVAVNDIATDGSTEKAGKLVMEADTDLVKLTFARRKRGHIKVCFPGGKQMTVPRGTRLIRIAEALGIDTSDMDKEGRNAASWYKDEITGEAYCLPLNVPGIIPSIWRKNYEKGTNEGVELSNAQYECWVPLKLVPAPEAYEAEIKKEADIIAKNKALRGNGKE